MRKIALEPIPTMSGNAATEEKLWVYPDHQAPRPFQEIEWVIKTTSPERLERLTQRNYNVSDLGNRNSIILLFFPFAVRERKVSRRRVPIEPQRMTEGIGGVLGGDPGSEGGRERERWTMDGGGRRVSRYGAVSAEDPPAF